MKLILEAIKALFRKVENAIQWNVAVLSKRLDSVDEKATKARTKADEAKKVADNALPLWKLVEIIPSGTTGTYEVTVPYFRELKVIGSFNNVSTADERVDLRLNNRDLVGFLIGPGVFYDSEYLLEVCSDLNLAKESVANWAALDGVVQRVTAWQERIEQTNTLSFNFSKDVSVSLFYCAVYYR